METKNLINTTMTDVIKVTKEARELLFKDGNIISTNREQITVVKTVIEANKNLVSAAQTMIKVQQL
jgi:hypothetical protein